MVHVSTVVMVSVRLITWWDDSIRSFIRTVVSRFWTIKVTFCVNHLIIYSMAVITPESFQSFGDLLVYLRRRAHLTQDELGRAVGYSRAHVTRLEKNQRLPDLATIAALFIPALDLQNEAAWTTRLLQLDYSGAWSARIAHDHAHRPTHDCGRRDHRDNGRCAAGAAGSDVSLAGP